jgi:tRNA pseudouridine38-40 synthase
MTEVERRADLKALQRTVSRIDVFEEGPILRLEFEGDGFLYKMVRLMTGSLVQVARGRQTLEWLESLVTDPEGPKSNQTAPADGLYLVKVDYAPDLLGARVP